MDGKKQSRPMTRGGKHKARGPVSPQQRLQRLDDFGKCYIFELNCNFLKFIGFPADEELPHSHEKWPYFLYSQLK